MVVCLLWFSFGCAEFLHHLGIDIGIVFSALTLLVGWQEMHLACKN